MHRSPRSKCHRQRRVRAIRRYPLYLTSVLAGLTTTLHGATQTWIGGTGSWATGTNWTPNNWVAGNTAVFGSTAGTVTVGTQTAGGLTFNVGGYTLASGTLTLNTGTVITTTGGGTTTFASALSLAGAGGVAITKTGSGSLVLSTGNGSLGTAAAPSLWTVTGGTKASNGLFDSSLAISFGSYLGATPATATTELTLDAGTLTLQGGTADNTNIFGATRTTQINAAGGAVNDTNGFNDTWQGGFVNNAGSGSSLYLFNKSATLTLSGVISGTGSVTWNGAGTLAPTAANTFSGGLTINAGTVSFVTDGNLGTGALSFNGGTLLSAQTAGVTMTRTINVGAGGGTIALDGKPATSSANKITLGTAGQITGSGPLTVTNNGLLSIGAANTGFTGSLTLNGGVTELTNNQAVGSGSITVNTGAELSTLGSQLANPITLNGGALSWDYYSGSGNYQGPITLQSGGGTVSLINFYAVPSAANLANNIYNINGNNISGSISGVISGPGALTTSDVNPAGTINGSGTLTITGANTYTGGTTVGVGTTVIMGNASALGATTNALTLAGTLSLSGYNLTTGALTITGASQGPVATSQVGTVGAGTLAYTFNGTSIEKVTAASVTINGTADVQINPANLTAPGTYTLVTSNSGTLSNAWEFAGAENMSVPVNSIIAKNNNGSQYDPSSYYRLTLTNNGTSEQVVASTDLPSRIVTIFPVGSSLTAGQSNQNPYNGGGYRTQLYQNLVNDGRFIPNYVGSSTSSLSNAPNESYLLASANQQSNEGHPGWTTLQILANLNMTNGDPGANGGYWLKPGNGENPNYITVNIGGNDAVDYGTSASVMAAASQRLDAIVTQFNNLRPGVATILSSIIFRNDNNGAYSNNGIDPYYNPAMQGVVFNHVLAGQNVSFLDLRNIISYPTDISSDNIHPTQAGYDKMANAWYQSFAYGQAYWTGSQDNAWNTVNGTATNFAQDAARTTDRGRGLNDATANQFLVYPDVFFNNNTTALNTTLGADTTVRSLNFASGATGPVTVGAGNTLTIGTVDSSVTNGSTYTLQNTGGITLQAGTGAHTIAANVTLGADQTWGNVSSNNLTVSGNIGGMHNLAFVGSYSVQNPGTYTPGTNYQNGTFTTTTSTVNGTGGGFVLSGANAYVGTTTISNVTVALDNAGSTTPRLVNTSSITLNPGGTLLLTSSAGTSNDRISNTAALVMAGGTLNTGGLSEGSVSGGVPTAGIGMLTLSANSVLELGNGASVVAFANSGAATWTSGTLLKIYDWTGSAAGGGTDQVYVGSDTTGLTGTQLGQVAFYSDAGNTFLGYGGILANGEIVPVPEASTWLGGALLLGVVGYRGRKRLYGWRSAARKIVS